MRGAENWWVVATAAITLKWPFQTWQRMACAPPRLGGDWDVTQRPLLLRLAVQMARDKPARDGRQHRLLPAAARHGLRAARVKPTSGWRVQRTGHLSRQDDLLAPFVRMARQRGGKQRLGVGMLRRPGERSRIAHLDDLAKIHHHNRVAHVRDSGEVV